MRKEKKPLILAIFLLGSLLFAESWIFGAKSASGVFGGPETPRPLASVSDNFGLLESRNLRGGSEEGFLNIWGGGALMGQVSKPKAADIKAEAKNPALLKYFAMPTTGLNWGKLHENNGVDISNSCGTPVVAAADGVVIPDPNLRLNDWSGGYGKFILIEHSNGTKTRYAHLSKVLVEPGEFVSRKQKIGLTGNTGKVDKATGCHLHFEVLGGDNPFAKD